MTGSSTEGIRTVLHPVTDLAAAKAVYTALLGTPPQHDAGPGPKRFVTAFGETKGVSEWARDPRCKVTLVTLLRRLDRGMSPVEAITAKPFRAP